MKMGRGATNARPARHNRNNVQETTTMPRYKSNKITLTCKRCARPFKMNPYRLAHSNVEFCSRKCRWNYPRTTEKTCEQCGKIFEAELHRVQLGKRVPRFCSHLCAMAAQSKPLLNDEQRFWPKVERANNCWLWRGTLSPSGYGVLKLWPRRQMPAHRYSYELHYGPIPDGMWVLHRCDNPPCVRPDHLFLGTNADNTADKVAKNRQARGKGAGTKRRLTPEQVIDIRERYVPREITCAMLAAEYGVCLRTIHDIVRRSTWKHI